MNSRSWLMPPDSRAAAAAWAEFLGRFGPWDWFTTHTWPKPCGPERRRKDFEYWVSLLCRKQDGLGLGRLWYRKPARARWILGWEPHRSGAMHAHALLAAPYLRQVDRVHWKECWFEATGGLSRVLAVEFPDAAQRYVTKYVAKGGEIELSPNIGEVMPTVRAPLLAKGWRTSPRAASEFRGGLGPSDPTFQQRG